MFIAHPQLFWAIRGGGINFGVVTTFELKCYPQTPEVFCGMLLYTPDKVEAVLRAADKFDREEMGVKEFFLSGMLSTPMGIVGVQGSHCPFARLMVDGYRGLVPQWPKRRGEAQVQGLLRSR